MLKNKITCNIKLRQVNKDSQKVPKKQYRRQRVGEQPIATI